MNSVDMAPVAHARPATVGAVPAVAAYWPALLLALAAVAQQALGHINSDVSWLLTVSERLLDGGVPYVDFIETNPPASILLYLPSVALARSVGLRPELMVAASVFALAGLSMFGAGRILASGRLLPAAMRPPLLAVAVFVLLLLPAKAFAQREHFAVLALLPVLAVLVVRLEGGRVNWPAALAAGVGGGIAVAIKPHFALALILPVLLLVWRLRSIRPVFQPEWFAAAAVVVLYGASVPLFFPAYLSDGLPLVLATYLPVREPLSTLVLRYGVVPVCWMLAGLAVVWRQERLSAASAVLLLAAAGFFLAYLIQGKGFLNHEYPATALTALAIGISFVAAAGAGRGGVGEKDVDARGRELLSRMLFLVGLAFALQLFNGVRDDTALGREVARLAPPHPRMIAVTPQLAVGHPLVRWLDGTWVGRACSLWVSPMVASRLAEADLTPQERKALLDYAARERQIFVEDVTRGRPDVILFEGPSAEDWVRSDPAVTASLQDYRPVAVDAYRNITILLRRPAPQL